MKRLVRIVLINWYRIEQLSIDIEGHTAVIGPNASGKSSLLDAVQAVMVGGDKNWWTPNASAGEKSTRSLRDYCLGVVREGDDAEISPELRARDHSLTYLTLVFRDDAGGSSVSLGLAMHARREESKEYIDGRFIAQDIELNLSDLVDYSPQGPVPKPWQRVHNELLQRCGTRLETFSQSGQYQRHLCAVLAGGNRHIDQIRFLRAFKNAITFVPIRNVSDFVRRYILEDRPIQVRDLQNALQRYREIRRRTREAQERERKLKEINDLYQRAEKAEGLSVAWRWVEKEALYNALITEIEPVREAIEERAKDIAENEATHASMNNAWQEADEAYNQASMQLAATNTAQRKVAIEAQRNTAETIKQSIEKDLAGCRSALGRVHRILDSPGLLDDDPLLEKLQEFTALLKPVEDLLIQPWPADPDTIASKVEAIKPLLALVKSRLAERHEALVLETGDLEKSLVGVQDRIKRLERGEGDLSPETGNLQKLLADHAIQSTPLCDCLDVTDEAWRQALESFLGNHREALLVSPSQVRDAITLYRQRGRDLDIHGSRIVNTLKTVDWVERREPASLAEMVISDNDHAVAYINRQAGRVIRVDSEEELLHHDRAITADLMLATGGAVLRMKPVELLLGRGAMAQRLEALKKRFQEEGQISYQKKDEKNSLGDFRESILDPFVRAVTDLPNLHELCRRRQEQNEILAKLDIQVSALADDSEYQRLAREVDILKEKRTHIQAQREERQERLKQLEKYLLAAENDLQQKEAQLRVVQDARHEVEEIPGFDMTVAAAHLAELEEKELFAEGDAPAWKALSNEAASRAGRQEAVARNSRSNARNQAQEYIARTNATDTPSLQLDEDHWPLAAWALKTLTDIRETQLAQYVVEAENALREAEVAFRADFIGKLQENLRYLEEQQKELNRNLRHRPFHGQYYHFVRNPERDLEAVLRWVESWTPEDASQVDTLFDSSSDPSHPHRDAIARVKALFMETGNPESKMTDDWHIRLADYRQYYHFDVRMTDEADGKGNPELLSRRLGKGSGGEHQSPFYVAIGAALTAAYRIERGEDGGRRGGLSLAMFDEAFSKLDVLNAANAVRFLDDLGLQVLLAAPDEKYGQIAEHVDTIVNVYRDGGAVHIDSEYIKPGARELLAADNPVRMAVANE